MQMNKLCRKIWPILQISFIYEIQNFAECSPPPMYYMYTMNDGLSMDTLP